jgi:subtilase family serine protease
VLKRRPDQDAALVTLLEPQQDLSSPDYHRWLTPDEFGSRFGASGEDVQAFTGWLQLHGFDVAGASRGRLAIEFCGTARSVEQAFHAPRTLFRA